MAERQVIGLPDLGDYVRWRGNNTTFNGQVTRIFRMEGQPDRYEVEWFVPYVLEGGNPINECSGDDLVVVRRCEEHRLFEALQEANRQLSLRVEDMRVKLANRQPQPKRRKTR